MRWPVKRSVRIEGIMLPGQVVQRDNWRSRIIVKSVPQYHLGSRYNIINGGIFFSNSNILKSKTFFLEIKLIHRDRVYIAQIRSNAFAIKLSNFLKISLPFFGTRLTQ